MNYTIKAKIVSDANQRLFEKPNECKKGITGSQVPATDTLEIIGQYINKNNDRHSMTRIRMKESKQ